MGHNSTFNREIPFQDFDPKLLEGKKVQVCTVRQAQLSDLSLGSLFWVLKAFQVKEAGGTQMITDFYDKRDSGNTGMVELLQQLGVQGEHGAAAPERAEDVQRDMSTWQRFCDYVRAHAEEVEVWKTIGTVRQGIDQVIGSESYEVPQSLERFLEELSVWVRDIDSPNAVQLLHHEAETTEWVRRLFPDAQKEFWKIDLPVVNEYRGKYRDVLDSEALGENCIVQRRVQDLAEKLAFKGLSGSSEEQDAWYQQMFDDLIEALETVNTKLIIDDWVPPDSGDYVAIECVQKVLVSLHNIDPKLIPFYLLRLTPAQLEYARLPDEDFSHGRRFPAGHHSYDPPVGFTQGVVLIGEAELRKPNPSLRPLHPFIPFLKNAHMRELHYPQALDSLLLSEKFSITDLAEFWIEVLKDRHDIAMIPSMYTYPIADKLALSMDIPEPLWNQIRDTYFSALCGMALDGGFTRNSVFKGDFREIPMIKRVLKERRSWLTEGHSLREFMDRLERKLASKTSGNDESDSFDCDDEDDPSRMFRR
ncbi:MAG: hypothetical protein NTX63_04020 [Candidatus Peregrinibacteria bacterium]|nr:hypothetical protein [Candidatus Peregrinibacteria bacterium]